MPGSFQKIAVGAFLFVCFSCHLRGLANSHSSQRLPPADEFRLTLSEAPERSIPLGPSCEDEASQTLACRAFTLDLENTGKHTVRISGLECFEPQITFSRKEPDSSSSWWPMSWPGQPTCKQSKWTNVRLIPGEHTQYRTRLISPRREIPDSPLPAGTYTLHADWALFGCTEEPEGTDCLSPLQIVREPSSIAAVASYGPVIVLSNEISVESRPLPYLGTPKFSFRVEAAPGEVPPASARGAAGCTPESRTIDCTVFRYSIRNLGERAIRNGTFSCSDSDITPEFRRASREWKPVQTILWFCSANVFVQTPILPGESIKGTFTLPTLAPSYDTSMLREAGKYDFRFTFTPKACFASPDGRFCLQRPEHQPSILSNEVSVLLAGTGDLNRAEP